MDKLDKYLRKVSHSVTQSSISESRYYTIGNTIIRVSSHIGRHSDGDFTIIIDRNNNYLLYNAKSQSVHLVSYSEVKLFIKSIVLCFETFSIGNPRLHQQLCFDNTNLKLENARLSKYVRSLEEKLAEIPLLESTKLSEVDPNKRQYFIHRLTKKQRQRVKDVFKLSSLQALTDEQLNAIFTFPEFQTWYIP